MSFLRSFYSINQGLPGQAGCAAPLKPARRRGYTRSKSHRSTLMSRIDRQGSFWQRNKAAIKRSLFHGSYWVPLTLVIVALCALVTAGIGLVTVSARGGHGPFLSWFLPYTRGNSVAAHAEGLKRPGYINLDSPALLERGAGHFDDSCVNCHGAPGVEPGRFSMHMLPQPPRFAEDRAARIDERSNAELQWVVWNGIMASGMPAWPDHMREEEPWAMVAFLRALPDLSAEEYAELAGHQRIDAARRFAADLNIDGELLANCAQCHGTDGVGSDTGAFPNLSLLSKRYLRASLLAYRADTRNSGIMNTQIHGLTEDELMTLADHYAEQPMRFAGEPEADRSLLEAGRSIATDGIDERDLAECVSCHSIGERTDTDIDDRVLRYPRLSGQYAAYLETQLHAFTNDVRGSARDQDPTIQPAHVLEPDEIEAVSAFYASLRYAPHEPESDVDVD